MNTGWLAPVMQQACGEGLAPPGSVVYGPRLSLPSDVAEAMHAHLQGHKGVKRALVPLQPPPHLQERLRVKPLHDDKQKLPLNEGHEFVGRHPFRCILSGESGTGKTTVLIHLLNHFYSPYFDAIYIWSPHFYIDSTWRNLKFKPAGVHLDFHEEHVDQILAQQDAVISKHGVLKAKKILLILDDMINERDAMKSDRITRIFTIGRHKNASVLVATQKLNKVGLTMRSNASLLCIFQASNGREWECILDEQRSQFVTRDMFQKIFNEAVTRHPHGFLTVNRQTKDPRNIYRFDLDTVVPITLSLEEQREALSMAAEDRKRRIEGGESSVEMSVLELMKMERRTDDKEKDGGQVSRKKRK